MTNTKSEVRVRIAPSPTGYPHIGTIWQALINFAFARHNKGNFIVRIEDTDRSRFVEGAEKALFDSLAWFDFIPDESPIHGGEFGPYKQSERLPLYQKYAKQLVEEGKAYYCTCSQERLRKVRTDMQKKGLAPMYDKHCRNLNLQEKDLKKGTYVIRMKIPDNTVIIVDDLLRGKIKFESSDIDDQVLVKSDGFPTYHLAVVVDDHLMKITHMVRAEEWLPSAPKNWLLYDYLGWKKPLFVHTPNLRNPDKSKMSKRFANTSAVWYQERFLKEAIINYLCLLGWSHPLGKEVFDLKEFIKYFDLKDMSVSGPVFDLQKLTYLNGLYLRQKSEEKLARIFQEHVNVRHLNIPSDWWFQIVPILKERIKEFSKESFDYWLKFFVTAPDWKNPQTEDELKAVSFIKNNLDQSREALKAAEAELKEVKKWEFAELQQKLLALCDSRQFGRGKFFTYLRIAIAGSRVSLPLLESMKIIGKDESLKRIENIFIIL